MSFRATVCPVVIRRIGHYQGPNHTLARLSHEQGSAANHEVTEMQETSEVQSLLCICLLLFY